MTIIYQAAFPNKESIQYSQTSWAAIESSTQQATPNRRQQQSNQSLSTQKQTHRILTPRFKQLQSVTRHHPGYVCNWK